MLKLPPLEVSAVKTCGACAACCAIVPVVEMAKTSYVRCRAMRDVIDVSGPGCSIYPNRPGSCRIWSCTWLTSPDLPTELRPDHSGVIIDPIVDLIKVNGDERPAAQIWAMPGHEDDFRTVALISDLIRGLLSQVPFVLWRFREAPGAEPMARVLCEAANGRLQYGPPSVANAELGTEAERFNRVDALMAKRRTR